MSLAGLKYFLTKPGGWFFLLSSRGLLNWMDDETYIRRVYRYALGCEPDLEHPKNFNEKLNWMKLHDRNPLYTQLVDKYEVKRFVAERIGRSMSFRWSAARGTALTRSTLTSSRSNSY